MSRWSSAALSAGIALICAGLFADSGMRGTASALIYVAVACAALTVYFLIADD